MIRQDNKEQATLSGLIIPNFDDDKTETGTVIAVGPGRKTKKNVLLEVSVAVGDRIMFDSGAGTPVRLDGEELLIIREDEIIGVVTDE